MLQSHEAALGSLKVAKLTSVLESLHLLFSPSEEKCILRSSRGFFFFILFISIQSTPNQENLSDA